MIYLGVQYAFILICVCVHCISMGYIRVLQDTICIGGTHTVKGILDQVELSYEWVVRRHSLELANVSDKKRKIVRK
jgi:hypothetical protein